MSESKFDFKKEYKDLYQPKGGPSRIMVPPMQFIMVDGQGAPAGAAYQQAVEALYALSFTIKMSKLGPGRPAGYFDYVVPPLEGLWWSCGRGLDDGEPKENWFWTSMIRQPAFVTPSVFQWALEECRRKKPQVKLEGARLETLEEGLCVQMMHIGPYDGERETIRLMEAYMEQQGLRSAVGVQRKHHEIYLGDPRRTAPEKLRTVLRLPVED